MAYEWGAALLASAGLVAAVSVPVFVLAALLQRRVSALAGLLEPLNALIFVAQVADGATTWVGVGNPFGLHLPPFRETVFVSGLVIESLGGAVYFVLKCLLGVMVALALGLAFGQATGRRERITTRLVQVTLVVIGLIPVWNNVGNLVALA